MRLIAVLLVPILVAGCYSIPAILDLAKAHPPSYVGVSPLDDHTGVEVETLHGTLPGCIRFSEILPDFSLVTRQAHTFRAPNGVFCQRLVASTPERHVGRKAGQQEPIEITPPTILYREGPFPIAVEDDPAPPEIADTTCVLGLTYGEPTTFRNPTEVVMRELRSPYGLLPFPALPPHHLLLPSPSLPPPVPSSALPSTLISTNPLSHRHWHSGESHADRQRTGSDPKGA